MATKETRNGLIDAATRVFADHGVQGASLVEITRRAGQRNRGAVHYHFGSRDGLLVAVLDAPVPFLAQREGELLAVARTKPDGDVCAVLEAVVRPAVELAESGWRGRCYLSIVSEVLEQDPVERSAAVETALTGTGGYAVYELLAQRMTAVDHDILVERLALLTSFILGAVARRARAVESGSGRQQLPVDRFVANLLVLATAMAEAPAL